MGGPGRERCPQIVCTTYDGVLEVSLSPLVDVLNPLVVRLEIVGRQPYDLDLTLREIGLTSRDFGKFSGADGSEVIGMREEDGLCIITFDERRSRRIRVLKLVVPKSHRSIHGIGCVLW